MTVISQKLYSFLVMTVDRDGNHFPYYEVAPSAKEAARLVRGYIDDYTKVCAVYKEVRTF